MKHLFIINPAAGSWDHTKQYTAAIVESCNARGLDYRVEVSKAPGECRRITREAGETGEEYRVYACGGDGTLNEVASGAAGFPNLAITAYSGGSGNDFVRLFSEPAAFSDLERLLDAKEVTFDMIRCNDDYALNICSVGLDARIGTDVARYKRLPLLQGFRAYVASTVVNVVRGIAEHYVVEICGETIDAQQTMICVCNGRFYGGGFNPVPEADPTDGLLDVLLVKKVSRLQVSSIIGHSERRAMGETDADVNAKVLAALNAGLTPIMCCGESLEQRQSGITTEWITMQIKLGLAGVPEDKIRKVIIAYEPIWAIGTGLTATPDQAEEVCENIRTVVRKLYSSKNARAISILYGGSMNDKNAFELLAQPDIDGGLIGGASLVPEKFVKIIEAANQPTV